MVLPRASFITTLIGRGRKSTGKSFLAVSLRGLMVPCVR